MSEFVAYQDIECVFPMSGQYGRAPRVLYYSLLLFVVILRRQDWLTAGAAAACLTFGGSAAIHALILVPTLSLGQTSTPDGNAILPNSSTVKVAAVATDLDSDVTLAIVGTGFLIVVPMALWSARFRLAGAVAILVLWISLISIGMVACITNLFAIDGSSTGPLRQFCFCSIGYNDTLPFSTSSTSLLKSSWNETVWTYFEGLGPSLNGCYYPCLSGTGFLRQPGDAKVVEFLNIEPPDALYWGLEIISAIIYGCVPLSIFFCIIILVLRFRGYRFMDWSFESYERSGLKRKLAHINIWVVNVYAMILMYFIFPVFLIWAEWIIYYDLQSESMQLIGQWAPLVGAGLAFIAAIVGKYWHRAARLWRSFWRRRTTVKTCSLDEDFLGSFRNVWSYDSSTAWSQTVFTNFGGLE